MWLETGQLKWPGIGLPTNLLQSVTDLNAVNQSNVTLDGSTGTTVELGGLRPLTGTVATLVEHMLREEFAIVIS